MNNFFIKLSYFLKIIANPNYQQPELKPLPAFWQMIPVKNIENSSKL
jgi:hypothetical protein